MTTDKLYGECECAKWTITSDQPVTCGKCGKRVERPQPDRLTVEQCARAAHNLAISLWARELYEQLADTMRENEQYKRREKILTDALREITQPCGMNYAGDSWEYTPKNYRDMAYHALKDIIPKIEQRNKDSA